MRNTAELPTCSLSENHPRGGVTGAFRAGRFISLHPGLKRLGYSVRPLRGRKKTSKLQRSPRRGDPACPHQVGDLTPCYSVDSTSSSWRSCALRARARGRALILGRDGLRLRQGFLLRQGLRRTSRRTRLCRPIFLLVKEPKLRTGLETHGQRQFALFRVECQELPGPKMQRGGHMQNVEGSMATVHRIVAAQALRFN